MLILYDLTFGVAIRGFHILHAFKESPNMVAHRSRNLVGRQQDAFPWQSQQVEPGQCTAARVANVILG